MKQSDLNDKNDCSEFDVDHPAVFAVTMFGASTVILAVIVLIKQVSKLIFGG